MSDYRFLFYSDEGQVNSDWKDTLAVLNCCAEKSPAQRDRPSDATMLSHR